jgi:hypothetical protein
VRLELRLEGGGEDAVLSLAEWLATVVRVVERADDRVAVEAYAGAASVLTVIAGWWRTRRAPMRLTISTESASVTIDAADPEVLAQVVNALIGGGGPYGPYGQYGSPPPLHPGGMGGPPGGPDFPTDR